MRPSILFPLFADTATLKGVGPRVQPALRKIAGPLVRDVVFTLPQGLVRRRRMTAANAVEGEVGIFEIQIDQHIGSRRPGQPYKVRGFDETGWVHLVYFKTYGDSLLKSLPVGARRIISGKVERYGPEVQVPHPDYAVILERRDEIPHSEALYPAGGNLSSRQVRRFALEALNQAPDLPEWQDPAWRAKQGWAGWRQSLEAVHHPASPADLESSSLPRRRLAFDELLAHQLALAQRKRARRRLAAPVLTAGPLSARLEASLPFSLTGAQGRALSEIRADLASGARMGRLLQGDVGSGKTAVALLAMATAVESGFQAALMAPTEILARQHHERLAPMFAETGVECVLLVGRDKGAARLRALSGLADGSMAVVIGTHALFQDAVRFANLGLAIVDEQHRFGVAQRNLLQAKASEDGGAHLLTMSATPIPRTLELTQYGDLDVSRLDEKPPGRQPITTSVLPMDRMAAILDRLGQVIATGAQAYWICPLVAENVEVDLASAEARAVALKARFGDRVGLVHGQMPGAEREAVMAAFAANQLSVLVATTVVEVGVDVPNATIMIIEQAERFGLAQLHQLRGRVGRGAGKSACVLLYDPPLSQVAQARLEVVRSTEDGFLIAEQDWAMRGGGDPLGLKQAGLPAYRFADPVAHRELLLAAADDARIHMARDPDFSTERGQALSVLSELFDWKPDRTDQPD
ncbi:MAG: ATP-dependent DNA helicase RecG [Caulobacterales bacterium]|nr:ATP-dependent DNA helicase RecG [Caulobacterales bacterium]